MIVIRKKNSAVRIGMLVSLLVMSCSSKPTIEERSRVETVESILGEFERQLDKDVKDDNIQGSLSSAVVKDDKIIWSKAFGYSNRDKKVLADTNTVYRTGSVTKSFTAFLMMTLAEAGTIKLSDPVELYLPEIRNLKGYKEDNKITFAQLASHTSGLNAEPDLRGLDDGPIEAWETKVLAAIPTTASIAKPGERYAYSNIGYSILGLALSRAAHQSYIDLVQQKIFDPLHMDDSYFKFSEDKRATLAQGLEGGPLGAIRTDVTEMELLGRGYKVPTGGIFSTPNDLARFVINNMGFSPLLKKESMDEMQSSKNPDRNSDDRNGYGFSFYRDKQLNLVEKAGGISGYTAKFSFDKDSHYGVVILRNSNWGITDINLRTIVLIRNLNELSKRDHSN